MILNPPHDLVDDRKRDEKPLAGLDRVAEAIRDFDLEASGTEKAMQQVLQPRWFYAREFVGRD